MLPLVDVWASRPHYLDHLRPIFDALPKEVQGLVRPATEKPLPGRLTMVASGRDAQKISLTNPIIYVEHGAGQAYLGDEHAWVREHPSYSGGGGVKLQNLVGVIAPSKEVAARWTTAPAVAVGCPKLDKYRGLVPMNRNSVCFTFHWEATLCPEAGTVWWHWAAGMPGIVKSLQEQGLTVFGHSHPRWGDALFEPMLDAGMTLLRTDADVFRAAGMLIADNTSLLPEMASLYRPVALLNCPQYRREVEHGGRFWEWPRWALNFDEPFELVNFDLAHWVTDTRFAQTAFGLAEHTYEHNDDQASRRAASFVVECLLEM